MLCRLYSSLWLAKEYETVLDSNCSSINYYYRIRCYLATGNLSGIVSIIISGIKSSTTFTDHMSSRILEEVQVLQLQQPPRDSISAIETSLRLVNSIGKSLALQKYTRHV